MKRTLTILLPIIICFITGFIASQFQADSVQSWYPLLNKPSLNTPNWAFPVAWNILYVLMGLSIGLIILSRKPQESFFIKLFTVQLLFNFTWSISFFYFRNPALGLANIIILEILIIYYAVKAYPVNKLSSILFIPYILWVGFATYLNLYIFLNN